MAGGGVRTISKEESLVTLQGYRVFDADAHGIFSPRMWEGLPAEYARRRPRPVRVGDAADMGRYDTGWLIEGRMEPHPFGPGAQSANTPRWVLEEFGASPDGPGPAAGTIDFPIPIGSLDLSDPQARLHNLDRMGIDTQMLFPSTLYAHMTSDPGFEAALYRAYNRYMARQCQFNPRRLKWAGLLPLRDPRQGCEALEEMQALGATAAVVFGTVGERLLSHRSFTPVWDEFARTGLPLCIHMGMSYPPFEQLCESIFDANVIAKALPAQLAFVAIVGHNMLDRYPDLNVAFLEFGAEWILYAVGKMEHSLKVNKRRMPVTDGLPRRRIEEYARSGRIFVSAEADDAVLVQEMELLGEDQILCSSDFPHGEMRENSHVQILHRGDLSERQKRKLLYDNSVRLFGEP
ncbi:MAG: amidohydrolase family protein [Deltaproteobacteria bacterium]|nr:amidohydrolase family protein [Deltaproteobacteria bacterium]MBI3076800.1 amidohydrolase family protein [Deltaproteobacteria bacterium]